MDFWDVNINMKMTPDFFFLNRNQCNLGLVGGSMVLVFQLEAIITV